MFKNTPFNKIQSIALVSSPKTPPTTTTNNNTNRALRTFMKSVLEGRDTRRILMFLCLNLTFTFVEAVYGYLTNSLSLISDASHMLFDCTALVIGLYAAYMSKWRQNQVCFVLFVCLML